MIQNMRFNCEITAPGWGWRFSAILIPWRFGRRAAVASGAYHLIREKPPESCDRRSRGRCLDRISGRNNRTRHTGREFSVESVAANPQESRAERIR